MKRWEWGIGIGIGVGIGIGIGIGIENGEPSVDSRKRIVGNGEWGMGSRRQAAGCHLVNFRENECIQKGL